MPSFVKKTQVPFNQTFTKTLIFRVFPSISFLLRSTGHFIPISSTYFIMIFTYLPSKDHCPTNLEERHKKTRTSLPTCPRLYAWSGAGGIRTHVQTGKPYAFYTFIPAFDFRVTARPGPPTDTLASKFHPCIEAYTSYFRFSCTANPSDSEQHPWSDVSSHHLMTG